MSVIQHYGLASNLLRCCFSLVMSLFLRRQIERILPSWERWYPSLFDAASDLGLIKARVCPPQALLLSSRHARIRRAAEDSHLEQWGGKE